MRQHQQLLPHYQLVEGGICQSIKECIEKVMSETTNEKAELRARANQYMTVASSGSSPLQSLGLPGKN
jgi:hypothetical protein